MRPIIAIDNLAKDQGITRIGVVLVLFHLSQIFFKKRIK